MDVTVDEEVARGYEALARGAWDEARTIFERTLARGIETPEAYEGLGMAAWWLEDVTATSEARGRAFRGYQASQQPRGAARVAIALAWDHLLAGEQAICRGWMQRARRLVQDLDRCPERGWLLTFDAHIALMVDHDAVAGELASVEAAALGRELAEVDLEMLGLAYQGLALVSQGRVSEGMQLLDAATVAALVGEIRDPDAAASCCCALIYACERVHDYPRAAEWCHRLKEMSARWSYRLMLSVCRTHYAGVLVWRGQWADAEAELMTALAAMEASRPGEAAEAVTRLGELRCRQGRFGEAAELFARTEADPLRAQGATIGLRGRAELALEIGDARAAAELAERYLRGVGAENHLERSGGLELLSRARALTGELDAAETAASELSALVAGVATEPVRAAACFTTGVVAAARGDHDAARRWLEDAVDHYQCSGGVFEAARARLELARTLAALGRAAEAVVEARAAYRVFHQLGASHAVAQTAALLHGLAGPPPDTVPLGATHLTPRELEILRMLARGLSNQQIADDLVLSVRTVERHIGNIYGKLGVAGATARAEAAVFVLTHGLD